MAADDESSDLSSLSSLSPVPSDAELEELSDSEPSSAKPGILKFFPKLSEQPPREPSPPPRKRSPSPPHEYVLADNPDIAFIVMFRSRFSDAFPKSHAHFGPQELERDIVEPIPGDRVEYFLCALLGLILNRKQDVKPGHYGRALEDAVSSHRNQWAKIWEDKSPLTAGATFNSMIPTERLVLLRTLILWSMSSSDVVKSLINQSYKQNRHDDDLNQPRSVQPWGTDADKRRYFLIEGQDDTAFRVYRESNPAGTNRTWWSVAGSIDELQALSAKLETKDGGPKARKLSQKILGAVPRFEAGEEKRRRRDYRQMRKEQFKRPEPGFSMYEGRTRGKRIKYTYSDDEDVFDSDSTNRRSMRNTGANTPVETGPITTSSGRQIKAPSRLNAATGDSAPASVQGDMPEFDKENSTGTAARPRRSAAMNYGDSGWPESGTRSRRNTSMDSDEDESEVDFGDDEEDVDEHVPEESDDEDDYDEDEAMVDDDLDDMPRSLVVKLSVTPPKLRTVLSPIDQRPNQLSTPEPEGWKPMSEPLGAPLVQMQDAPIPHLTTVSDGVSVEKPTESKESKEPKELTSVQSITVSAPVARTITPEPTIHIGDAEAASQTPVAATSLAFRGSPEKPPPQTAPRPIDVGNGE